MFANLTDEQLSIQRNCAALSLLPSMRMRIIARAGTGKTTSLEAVVMKIRMDRQGEPSICYAAFNKTTETEFGERINKKLTTNYLSNKDIESRTLHSLCYNWFIGTRNNEYIRDMKDNIETDAVVKYFQIEQYVAERYGSGQVVVSVDPGKGSNKNKQQRIRFEATWVAELILKTLDNFLNSASVDVTDKHLPYHVTYRYLEWTSKLDAYLIKHRIMKVTAAQHYSKYDFKGRAMALYQQALAMNEASGIAITHSVYQKFAQLSNAVLTSKRGKPFDVYLIDEAQDLNECQCAMITRQWQNGSTIALVGDPAQSIYQFRGACRQFERWEVDCEETLTQSFRFGKEIARLANIFLGLEKLWLLSLKTAIEAKGVPVKREFGKPATAPGPTPGPTPGTQACDTPGADGDGQSGGAGGLSMIKALVRGLGPAQDRWVQPQTPLEYPYTVICRTNNCTYYALLAGIYEAVRQQRLVEGVDAADGDDTLPSLPLSMAGKRGPRGAVVKDENTSSSRSAPPALGKRTLDDMFNPAAATTSSSRAGVAGAPHSAPPVVFDLTDNDGEDTQGSLLSVPASAPSSLAAPMYTHHTLTKSNPGSAALLSVEQQGPTSFKKPVTQVTSNSVSADNEVRKRLFYINGVRSFAQLENGLVRRIEQLATVSVQKPYMYKGEQYTTLDDVKKASLEMEDVPLLELVEITEQWGADIGRIKELIAEHYAPTAAEADVLVTTVHKSKGLEWGSVALGDDIGSPLAAQPLFTVQCNPDPKATTTGRPAEAPRFIVALEKSPQAAYERVNYLLCVRKSDATVRGATKDASSAVAGGNVKAEPGLQAVSRIAQLTGTGRGMGAAAALPAQGGRVGALFRDDADVEVLEDEAPPTSPGHYPRIPEYATSGPFAPSAHHTLVPLLPSTVALGQQLQRGITAAGFNGAATPGGGSSSLRGSKCPLICCSVTHLSCAERVRQMYHHEIAERRRLHGGGSVAGMETTGDGPSNYRLMFGQEQAQLGAAASTNNGAGPHPGGVPGSVVKKERGDAQGLHQPDVVNDPTVPRVDPFLLKFMSRQSANEWYVAVTRAKHTLRVNGELSLMLEWIERDIGGLRTQLRQVIGEEADPFPVANL